MNKPIYIDRPPRIQPELPSDEISIPSPPDKQEEGYSKLIQVALPMVTIIGYVLVSTLGGAGRSPFLMIPMALSVVASTAFSVYSYFKEKNKEAEAKKAYSDRLVELNKEMHTYHDLQRRFYRYNYSDPNTAFDIVRSSRIEADNPVRELRSKARLWERRISDDDFCAVRLGVGTLPSTVIYHLGEIKNFDDPLAREAMKLEADSKFVSNTPLIIALRSPKEEEAEADDKEEEIKKRTASITPVTHALGVAGQRSSVYEFVRSMLVHYCVFQAPGDARLYVLASKKTEWEWTDHMPHSMGDEQNRYTCFLSEIKEDKEENAFDDEGGELDQYLEGIRKILAQRKIRLEESEHNSNAGGSDPTLPFLLVVVDLLDVSESQDSRLRNIEADAAISILIEQGAMLGAAVVFLVPERAKVPSGCRSVIEIEKTTPSTNSKIEQHQKLFFRYAEIGINSFRYVGEADYIAQREDVSRLAKEMTNLTVQQSGGANLANTVPFMDLMGYGSMQELKVEAQKRWHDSTLPQYANWLRVKVGLMSGNKPRTLVFSAKRDGVHGMVAGSTGSGKSELLISMITGMAVTYDPTVINFVLVDYKGGGAFKEFEDLPHCVDIITNLGGDGVTRMFTAITAEMQRRQRLNAETGTKNIVEYRQKGLHQTREPYPYLFIIIDEFAEMIADRAEYKSQLEMITRVGRAQGVSLLLAAQRPSGVTDQMRSNIKFRICLRVETPGESREMLRRAEAAFLPPGIPGRGYLQVGNEEIELIQSAYTGEKYIDPSKPQGVNNAGVIWPDRGGKFNNAQDQQPPELYKAIIEELKELSRVNRIPVQRAPWPDFLPRDLSLTQRLITSDTSVKAVTFEEYLVNIDRMLMGQPRETEVTLNPSMNRWLNNMSGWIENLDWKQYAVRPVMGLIDNPYAAKQLPMTIDFPRGHVVVFGASGWGKTTFLRSTIVSLAASHSPNQAHIYILDLGGRNLGVLEKLPHVGALITPDEEGYKERIEQLLREIEGIVDKRKELLNNAGVADIYQYNAANPQSVQPAIVVAVDNFVEFVETFGNQEDNVESVLDKYVVMARQAKAYGIHFIISVNQLSDLNSQLYSIFTERYTLKLSDATEYRAIVGGAVDEIRDIAGRGYTKEGIQPLSFQVATPFGSNQGSLGGSGSENRELEQLAQTMTSYMQAEEAAGRRKWNRPVRVDSLPKAVLFKQLLARQHGLELDAQFHERLKAITKKRWADTTTPQLADWLKVSIGVIPGNRPRLMELEAKKDGVHGMIAGGTGAGKSELLMTLIVGLALNYDPSILNFVLVDYKGGGAFAPFRKLPHVVDLITNLNKAAVRRMFTAINAEMQRRQKLNADTGTKDIVEYRAKGFHLDPKFGPYPHLFIIIDEYAEMISDSPEFKDELDSITRVGRAQGVNLLLASQRPTGVTDQMRANIKFRICLRVEGVDTSREMLRRSDAALLPNGMPGRGYMQVGNENIELVQVAYTGDTYQYADVPEGGEKPKFYDVIVNMCNELLEGRQRPRTPWPPFLPTALTPADPLIPEYLDQSYKSLITLDQTNRLALNPFVQDWIDGKGKWHGVDWTKNAMRAIAGLLDDPYSAAQRPLVVDFTRGHAVLFGASGWGKTTFLRSLIMSLAGTHSPDEFHAHVLDLGGRNLEVLTALPHVGTIIMPDDQGYEERVQQLWREINDILDQRKKTFSAAGVSTLYEYNSTPGVTPEPAILVAIDNIGEYIETFGQGKDENNLLETFVTLARQGKAYGLHFVITAGRLNILTSKLYSLFTERLTLRLSDGNDYPAIVGTHIGDIEEVPGRGFAKTGRRPLGFQILIPPGAVDESGRVRGEARQIRLIGQKMEEFVKASNHKYLRPLNIGALPKSSSYRDLLRLPNDSRPFVEKLKELQFQAWTRNRSPEAAEWLKVTLGIASGEKRRTLHLAAQADGVHGMIAGGTGSGKSEVLMTLIVGLALNYSPDILNFVLVDYKGGGAFKAFETLPHVVDIVTNLNKSAVDRMFTSIHSEIRRRQALNAETGTKDIIEYRKKGLHLTESGPYPHLFIIIDEYAEMFDANPEYLPGLESITRVGRAQGVNLLLASQRPKGVSDQMRANIKLRICLKVEQADTSRELLRRPDAAFLPNGTPGRGYIQAGNENLELLQVSYTGEKQADDRERPLLWPERPERPEQNTTEEPPKVFDQIVKLSRELVNFKPTAKPWPGFLPESFSLESPLLDAQKVQNFVIEPAVTNWVNGDAEGWPGVEWRGKAMRPAVLLVDEPSEARQYPHAFDLTRNHVAIMGDAGMGKTTLLRSILVSLAATHSPDEFHAYVLDLGGRNFRALEGFPHVGTVIYADEEAFEERMLRLLEKLNRMLDERQQIFSDADASNLIDYNERFPQKSLPAVVVAIDNFAVLQEGYEGLVEGTILPLVRRALGLGITFVVGMNVPNNMASKVYNLFGERITFKQANTDRYMDIVGRGAIEIDDVPGRGYIRLAKQPLQFQAAQPVGIFNAEGRPLRPEGEELRLMGEHMQRAIEATGAWRSRPDKVAILPELVALEEMLKEAGAPPAKQIQAVLGQNAGLKPATFDLRRMGPHFMIAGPTLSGKTTAIYSWIFSLAQRYTPEQVRFVLIDTQGKLFKYGGQHSLDEIPHVLATVSEVESLGPLVSKLEAECTVLSAQEPGKSAIFVIIDNFDDFTEETSQGNLASFSQRLATLARRHGSEGLHFVIGASPDNAVRSDLRRRIQSSNYGLGLRTQQAVEVLGVQRAPSAVRGKELPIGRGFIVKAGQATMIQVGSPYDISASVDEDDIGSEQEKIARSLDRWIEEIIARYPKAKAAWVAKAAEDGTAAAEGQVASSNLSPAQLARMNRMRTLLKTGMQRDLERSVKAGETNGDMIVSKLMQMDIESWNSEPVMQELLNELLLREQVATMGLPREMVENMYTGIDTDSVLDLLEASLSS